jgi:FKBP-type peptidyl-prolyl cis-trans isomerase
MRFPRPARLAPLALAAALLVTACGDATEEEGSSASTTAVTDTTTSDTAAADATTEAPATTVDANVPPKPTVEIPSGAVTELVVTALVEGEGDGAAEGDTVIVHYVGVRSEDGAEFDNSYDRGEPFPVALGAQTMIPGWEQGLLGVKSGGQYQLDIPAELAYGDNPQGDIIQAGDALTFVVDVMAIIPATDPADAPDVTVEGAANRDELLIEDLVVGDGKELELGQTAYLHLIAFRADTGEQVASSWETGQPQPIQFAEQGSLPGIIEGMAGMKVGGSRKMIIPFADAFGSTGNPDLGIPADTDLVLVIDLIAIL